MATFKYRLQRASTVKPRKNQVISERVVCMNQLHAEKTQAMPNLKTIKRLNERILLLQNQEKEINADMLTEAERNKDPRENVRLLSRKSHCYIRFSRNQRFLN